jgi:hypothetical protein
MSYLRNSWSVKLRAIENFIRSIERNMRLILRTVYALDIYLARPCFFRASTFISTTQCLCFNTGEIFLLEQK